MTHNIRIATEQPPAVKRILLGEPIPSDEGAEQLLPKRRALPIFASDALSSGAYAPQELVMILMTGGLALLAFTPAIAPMVVVLLIVVVLSYRQLIRAYPSGGGGDYEVARTNLGEIPGVIVAAALLVDYVLTVAVSVASGVDNIISAVPELASWRVGLAVAFVAIIIVVNLRGVREASFAFAIPTYVFVGSVALMVVTGLVRTALGDAPVASSAAYAVQAPELAQAAVILIILRAFSSGCSALTRVEAVSNGVPAFRRPKVRNAQTTLTLMGSIAIFLFAGLTRLVTDLLDVSRAEAGVLAVSLSEISVEDAVGAAIDELGLGPSAMALDIDDHRIVADPVLLQRVLVNLVANAQCYAPAARPVLVATHADDFGSLRIEVVDHGSGIPHERRDAVFAPFQRAGERDDSSGLGLGLVLSRGFTEGMGGTLTLNETPRGGATLCVRLPLTPEGRS